MTYWQPETNIRYKLYYVLKVILQKVVMGDHNIFVLQKFPGIYIFQNTLGENAKVKEVEKVVKQRVS